MERITLERRGHVLMIGLNRADKRNAMDLQMYHEIASAYGELDSDPELRCGFVFAHGDHFTAGLELTQWTEAFGSGKWPDLADDQRDPFGLREDKRCETPIVFAMQGICFTVAIEMALAADVRVAAEGCRFGQIEVRRGIYACGGATLRMVQEFGWGNAQRYLLTGDEFNAQEALRIGLVQQVLPDAKACHDTGLEIAEKIAAQAPLGVAASLKSSRLSLESGQRKAITDLMLDMIGVMRSDDAAEGVRSFVERRPARFTGR